MLARSTSLVAGSLPRSFRKPQTPSPEAFEDGIKVCEIDSSKVSACLAMGMTVTKIAKTAQLPAPQVRRLACNMDCAASIKRCILLPCSSPQRSPFFVILMASTKASRPLPARWPYHGARPRDTAWGGSQAAAISLLDLSPIPLFPAPPPPRAPNLAINPHRCSASGQGRSSSLSRR